MRGRDDTMRHGRNSHVSQYADAYQRSLSDPEGFWLEAARSIDWMTSPTRALDDQRARTERECLAHARRQLSRELPRQLTDGVAQP